MGVVLNFQLTAFSNNKIEPNAKNISMLAEAFQIQQKVFPDKDIYYLFDLEDRQAI